MSGPGWSRIRRADGRSAAWDLDQVDADLVAEVAVTRSLESSSSGVRTRPVSTKPGNGNRVACSSSEPTKARLARSGYQPCSTMLGGPHPGHGRGDDSRRCPDVTDRGS